MCPARRSSVIAAMESAIKDREAAINKAFSIKQIRDILDEFGDMFKARRKTELVSRLRMILEDTNYNGLLEYDDVMEYAYQLFHEDVPKAIIIRTHDSEYKDDCPICFCQLSQLVFKCQHCNHETCESCMRKWLSTQNLYSGDLQQNCPHCSSNVVGEHHIGA